MLMFRDIPVEVRDRFKAACSLKQTTMRKEIVRLMNETSAGAGIAERMPMKK